MKNKKGALELSVTAIVVLILAIVMLGLGLGFVRGMFGKTSTTFKEQVIAEPAPPKASLTTPITLSREVIITQPGEPVWIKAEILNPRSSDMTQVGLALKCTKAGAPANIIQNPQFNELASLAPGKSFTNLYVFEVPSSAAVGSYLCQFELQNSGLPVSEYNRDLTVNIG